jgi:hypothetical protein
MIKRYVLAASTQTGSRHQGRYGTITTSDAFKQRLQQALREFGR